jgi:hypothetical protein
MSRIVLVIAACVSTLAVALSATPAGAAANPASKTDTPTVSEQERHGTARAAAWDCRAGYSCYYTGLDGTGAKWEAPGCGTYYLDGTQWQNNLYSIDNRGSGRVEVYNRIGTNQYDRKGWVDPGQQGNFHQNISADMVKILC